METLFTSQWAANEIACRLLSFGLVSRPVAEQRKVQNDPASSDAIVAVGTFSFSIPKSVETLDVIAAKDWVMWNAVLPVCFPNGL